MQGVILKCTRHECSVFVNLRPHLLRIRSRHQVLLSAALLRAKFNVHIIYDNESHNNTGLMGRRKCWMQERLGWHPY